MTKEQLKVRSKQRRQDARDAANYCEDQLSEILGATKASYRKDGGIKYGVTLAARHMRIRDLAAFRILYNRLTKLNMHMTRYYFERTNAARQQRHAQLMEWGDYDAMASLARKYVETSKFEPLRYTGRIHGNGAPEVCKHGVWQYRGRVLYCSLCGFDKPLQKHETIGEAITSYRYVPQTQEQEDIAIVEGVMP